MEKPTLLYFFPHVYLKDAIFNLWPTFSKTISEGPSALKKNLINGFEQLKADPQDMISKKDVVLDSEAFDSQMADLGEGKELLIIKFPTPQETTEVSFVAILMSAGQPRYFTFELHRPNEMERQMFPERKNDRYEVCEWLTNGSHNLTTGTDDASLDAFVGEIKKVVA